MATYQFLVLTELETTAQLAIIPWQTKNSNICFKGLFLRKVFSLNILKVLILSEKNTALVNG